MISQEEALEKILASVRPRPTRRVDLAEALDCFVAEDLPAVLAVPPFDNSAMDGYAVVASAAGRGRRLHVLGEQPAGIDRGLAVAPGEAIRIFTGGPLPAGADAVVMQEDVTRDGDEIIVNTAVETGEFVRRRGGDIAEGQRMLACGERITPQRIALLAAQGMGSLGVGGEVRVALISTGDELAPPGTQLQAGQIYDSNSALLRALLQKCGAKVASVVHCADRAEEIEAAVRAGTEGDALVITGGVSVGARDYVKEGIGAVGGALDLWRVAVKPGKPFLFGRAAQCAIFGLPGNPVSAFVTFLLFVRPALLKMMGANAAALRLPATQARLETELWNDGNRPHYLRGSLSNGAFRPSGRQESHALFGLSQSNALLLLGPGERLENGALATVFTWD
ncbi:MAG: gephyrin-like molybdotransferase Glp [Chthoniobacterales bacterium]